LPALLAFPSSFLQLAIPIGEDLSCTPFQLVQGRDVPDPTVQPHGVVMVNEVLDKSSAILLGKRATRPETIDFETLVPSLDFTVGMGRELHPMQRIQNGIFM